MTTQHSGSSIVCALLLASAACGPRLAGSSAEGGTNDDSTTNAESTTGGSASGTSAEGSETGDSLGLAPEHDLMSTQWCNMFEQDCPDGQKCVPYWTDENWLSHKCVPILGEQPAGEPCVYDGNEAATDDCDGDSACWDAVELDGELIGTCYAFCMGTVDTPICPDNSACSISANDSLELCVPTCDPLEQDCAEGLACTWATNAFNCIFTTMDIPVGEPCGFINDCAASLVCLTAEVVPGCESSWCCGPFCNLELGDGPCAVLPGTSCVAFFEQGEAPGGYEHIGVCISP